MSWGDLALSGGLDLLKQGMAYSAAADKAKSDRAWQAYNNAMTNIQNGQNQNAITTNENEAAERKQAADFALKRSGYVTEASVVNNAATTGTVGRSVNAALFQVQSNLADKLSSNENNWENQEIQFDSQRMSSNLQTQMQQDLRTIPDPNPATYMLGFASSLAGDYQKQKGSL